MISFHEALKKIEDVALRLRATCPLPVELRPIEKAVGAILAEDLLSPEDLPSFDNSAMDGFAFHSADTISATATKPVVLIVKYSVVAGDAAPKEVVSRGTAAEIMTGAPLPFGCDAIVKVEDVKVERSAEGSPIRIEVSQPILPQNFVRPRGGDLRKAQMILERGARIQTPTILALAALGYSTVPVFRKLKVARISTGKEVVAHDAAVGPGQVRNSTAPYFAALTPLFDAQMISEQSVGDEAEDFAKAVRSALAGEPDLIFTSGAVSMGKHDYVVETLKTLGAQIHFHKVAIQPGKPLLFATFPNGSAVFGLPGNPVSGTVGIRFFAETYIRTLRFQPAERPIQVPILKAAKKPAGLTQLAKAIVKFENGRAFASVMAGQMSSMVSPLLEANAWAVIDEASPTIEVGQTVHVYPLLSTQPFF